MSEHCESNTSTQEHGERRCPMHIVRSKTPLFIVACQRSEAHGGTCIDLDGYAICTQEIAPEDRLHARPERWWWRPTPTGRMSHTTQCLFRDLVKHMSADDVRRVLDRIR